MLFSVQLVFAAVLSKKQSECPFVSPFVFAFVFCAFKKQSECTFVLSLFFTFVFPKDLTGYGFSCSCSTLSQVFPTDDRQDRGTRKNVRFR
jgi:hypothetical protein